MAAFRASLGWRLAYWISRLGSRLAPVLGSRLCYALAVPPAALAYALLGGARRSLIANLERVVGPEAAPAAARRSFRNFARYLVDLHQLPVLGKEALLGRVDFDEWQALDEALAHPGGTIFVTLHLGQHEAGAAVLAARGHSVNVIAQTLPYAPLDALVQGLRGRLGMTVVPADKAKLGARRSLGRGEVLGTFFDAVEPGKGLIVDFLGAPTEVSAAPARIARSAGARVLAVVVGRDRHDPTRLVPSIDFGVEGAATDDEEADVRALTEALARSFEGFVRRYPDQWFAFRPLWPRPEAESPPDHDGERWKQWSLSLAAALGGRLPRPIAYGLAKLACDLAYRMRKGAREDVEDNMRHVMGPEASPAAVQGSAREAFRNVGRYYTDLIRLPGTTPARLLEKEIRVYGLEILKDAAAAGRGVVAASAHLGNPEMAIQVAAQLEVDVLVLAEPLAPPAFARLMRRIRSTFGPRYVDVGYGALAEALRHLRGGGLLAITCDRDIQGTGVPLPFFGEPAPLPLGAVQIAARTGSLLVPGYCRRRPGGLDVVFEAPVDLVDSGDPHEDAIVNARAVLARVEPWLHADPGQWMVLERIWKPLPPAAPEAAAPGATITPVREHGQS